MKGNRLSLLIISFVILVFDVALAFILNAYSVKNVSILYIVSKCIAVIALIGTVVIGFFKKDIANYILIYVITIIYQFVPLSIRYLLFLEKGFIISILILFISTLVYLGLEFGLISLSKKTLKSTEELKGKEIGVKTSDKYE